MTAPALRTVLVASTLSADSDTVVSAAAELARAAGARLHVVHAMLLPLEYDDAPGSSWRTPEAYAALDDTLRSRMADQLTRLSVGPDVLASAEIVDGTPWRVIRARATDLDADLIVVGATDGDGLIDRLLGSTATHVLSGADRPVLVVRGGADGRSPGRPARVLAPVDLSPLAGKAFAEGCALVAAIAGGTRPVVQALFVLDPRQRAFGIQFSPEQMDRFTAAELARFVDTHGDAAGAVDVQCAVRVGTPREAIDAAAAEWSADWVVIGTHGYTGWDRRVFGSVAAEVMQQAPCSVLIIPAQPDRTPRRPA